MKPKTVGRVDGATGAVPPGESNTSDASGLPDDSIIMTLKGEMRVRDLLPGDRVITRDSGVATIRTLQSHQSITQTVQIKAGSLGHTRPQHDVILPASQPILIRDWRAQALFGTKQALVRADRLVDGEFITRQGRTTLTLYDITFDRPHILYVDGLEVAGHCAAATTAIAA